MNPTIKFDDIDIEDFRDDDEDIDSDSMRIVSQFILDGATTLSEAAELARVFATYLEELENDGYQLTEVISRGQGKISLDAMELEDSIF